MTEYGVHNTSEDTHDIPPRRCYEEILLLPTIVSGGPSRIIARNEKARARFRLHIRGAGRCG
jgi:hypothetical protein